MVTTVLKKNLAPKLNSFDTPKPGLTNCLSHAIVMRFSFFMLVQLSYNTAKKTIF